MLFLPPENTLHSTSSHTVSLYTAVLGEVTVCLCPQNGWTALHLAAQEGKVDVVRLLTEAQAQVNIRTKVKVMFVLLVKRLLHYHYRREADPLTLPDNMGTRRLWHCYKS